MDYTRRIYLDNIRWITVCIVVIYHVIYMFNGVQTFGVIGSVSGASAAGCISISGVSVVYGFAVYGIGYHCQILPGKTYDKRIYPG